MIYFFPTTTEQYSTVRYRTCTARYGTGTVLGNTKKTPEGDDVHSENVSPLGTRRRGTLIAFILPWGHSYEGDKNVLYKPVFGDRQIPFGEHCS